MKTKVNAWKKILVFTLATVLMLTSINLVPIKANAATAATVYYKFTRKTSGFVSGQQYLFVPGEVPDGSCLTEVPSGSAILQATSSSNNSKSYASGKTLSTYVDVVQKGRGFDSCPRGGLYNSASCYYCYAGGVQNLKGYVYTYEKVTLQPSMISATVKPGTKISDTGATTLDKNHIEMTITPSAGGESYVVTDYTLNDNQVNPTSGDNTITATFGGVSTTIKVKFNPQVSDFKLVDGSGTAVTATHSYIKKGSTIQAVKANDKIGTVTTYYYDEHGNEYTSMPTKSGKYTIKVSSTENDMYHAADKLNINKSFVVYNEDETVDGKIYWDYNYTYNEKDDSQPNGIKVYEGNAFVNESGIANVSTWVKIDLYKNGVKVDTKYVHADALSEGAPESATDDIVVDEANYSFEHLVDVDATGTKYSYAIKVTPVMSNGDTDAAAPTSGFYSVDDTVSDDIQGEEYKYDAYVGYEAEAGYFDAKWKVTITNLPKIIKDYEDNGDPIYENTIPSAIMVQVLRNDSSQNGTYEVIPLMVGKEKICFRQNEGQDSYSYEGDFPVLNYPPFNYKFQIVAYEVDGELYDVSGKYIYKDVMNVMNVTIDGNDKKVANKVMEMTINDLDMPIVFIDLDGGVTTEADYILADNFTSKVDFDATNGGFTETDGVVTYGLEIPKKEGYKFTNWVYTADTHQGTAGSVASGVITLTDYVHVKAVYAPYPAPSLTPSEETYMNRKDGELTGLDPETMEYSLDGGISWEPVKSHILSGFSNETIWVRYKETKRDAASESYKHTFTPSQNKYTITYSGADVEASKVAFGGTITKPEDPTKEGYVFVGWYKDDYYKIAWNFKEDIVTTDYTLHAKWLVNKGHYTSVHGHVTSGGTGVPHARVDLTKGTEIIATTVTDGDGYYVFNYIEDGEYDVVITSREGQVKTALVEVDKDSEVETIETNLPQKSVHSILEIFEEEFLILVGGLDRLAESYNPKASDPNADIEIRMTVDEIFKDQEGLSKENENGIIAIEEETHNKNINFFDLSIYKKETYTDESGKVIVDESRITDTDDIVIETMVPYDMDGKTNVYVHRSHDDKVETFKELKKRPTDSADYKDGTFIYEDGYIIIYATKYSVYSISYSYELNVNKPKHGNVTVTPDNAKLDEIVTIKPTPDAGYRLSSLTVVDGKGNPLKLIDNGDGTYSYVQPDSAVSITAEFEKIPEAAPSPKTGDSAMPIVALAGFILSAMMVAFLSFKRRRLIK